MRVAQEKNWAGNYSYRAGRLSSPASVAELQELVATSEQVRALGTRHSFTALPDTEGTLVSTAALPVEVCVDPERSAATVSGGASYGFVSRELDRQGWALTNLASLPHISVAGAVATATHGSGDQNRCLAAAVRAVDLVGADGELRRFERGDPDFEGTVVALGCLGPVVRLDLDIEPAFRLRQDVYTHMPWDGFLADPAAVTGAAYSVSIFTTWTRDDAEQVWLKSRAEQTPPEALAGARRSETTLHMLRGGPIDALTEQQGVVGAWHERLPHFRLDFTPSRGEELQSEYLLPREQLPAAVEGLRRLGPRLAAVLQISEIRTVAADELWLSGAFGRETVGVHFTWLRAPERVQELLPEIEAVLMPLGARPHWGKCWTATNREVSAAYPRMGDFLRLRERLDPGGKFLNAFLRDAFGLDHARP